MSSTSAGQIKKPLSLGAGTSKIRKYSGETVSSAARTTDDREEDDVGSLTSQMAIANDRGREAGSWEEVILNPPCIPESSEP